MARSPRAIDKSALRLNPSGEAGNLPPPTPLTFCFVSQHCRQLYFSCLKCSSHSESRTIQVKINSVVQIKNKLNSRVRFGIPASLLLFGDEETNLAMWVVKFVSPSVFDVGLSTVCLLRKREANSLKHPPRTLCALFALVRKSFLFVKPPSRIRHLSPGMSAPASPAISLQSSSTLPHARSFAKSPPE